MTDELTLRERDRQRCEEHAPPVYAQILKLLEQLNVSADVSYKVTEEVIIHYWRDIDRLFSIHHEQVHPSKAASYLAFWIRKLKPISNAFPVSELPNLEDPKTVPHKKEICDINEQISVYTAIHLCRNCIEDKRMEIPGVCDVKQALEFYDRVANNYLKSEFEDGMSMGRRFESIVYDMRFRTYGPHHLTHLLTHVIREVSRECGE